MRVSNRGADTVWFRDDTGKHALEPGTSIEVAGDQHLPLVLSLPGVVDAATPPPRKAREEKEPDA